jgi:hypothetical protein
LKEGVAATENNSAAWFEHPRVTKVLSYVTAAWCGISLTLCGAVMTATLSSQTYTVLIDFGTDIGSSVGELSISVFLGGLIVLALGVASGRFLLRAIPPQSSGQARRTRFQTLCVAIAICVAFMSLFILEVFVLAFMAPNVHNSPSTPSDRGVTAVKNILVSIPFVFLWAIGAIGPLILRHRKPLAFLDRPFVLFLRRFSTFSDRAVIALVLKQAPSGVPVVFLTPTFSRPGDWDPFVVGIAGLKLFHPWSSVPIVLRAKDDDWQRTADDLIRRAQTILLDISDTSSSIRTEVELIEKASRWPDTVFLRLLSFDSSPCTDLFDGTMSVRTINYKMSWVWAFPRMVIGLIAVLSAALMFWVPFRLLFYSGMWVLGFIFITIVFIFVSVFVRPTIDREAKKALRTVLRADNGKDAIGEYGSKYKGVKGWLLILCLYLIIIIPGGVLFNLFSGFAEINIDYPGMLAFAFFDMALGTGLMIFSIYSGVTLWKMKPNAVRITKYFLIVCVIYNIIMFFIPNLFFDTMLAEALRGEMTTNIIVSIMVCSVCLSFLKFSKRIKANYNPRFGESPTAERL